MNVSAYACFYYQNFGQLIFVPFLGNFESLNTEFRLFSHFQCTLNPPRITYAPCLKLDTNSIESTQKSVLVMRIQLTFVVIQIESKVWMKLSMDTSNENDKYDNVFAYTLYFMQSLCAHRHSLIDVYYDNNKTHTYSATVLSVRFTCTKLLSIQSYGLLTIHATTILKWARALSSYLFNVFSCRRLYEWMRSIHQIFGHILRAAFKWFQ